jgi:hypothetical protein
MSADTTMAILKTQRPCSPAGQWEFRVALVQAVENAYPTEGEGWASDIFRAWYVALNFRRSKVYRDAKTARKAARRKAYRFRRRGGILEHGVVTVHLSKTFPLLSAERLEVLMRKHRVFPFNRK